jgi:hypothetical protein
MQLSVLYIFLLNMFRLTRATIRGTNIIRMLENLPPINVYNSVSTVKYI